MQEKELEQLLGQVASGEMDLAKAKEMLLHLPYEELQFAKIDHHREMRQGVCEVIYGAGKTAEQISQILQHLLAVPGGNLLATRVEKEKAAYVQSQVPQAQYDPVSRLLYVRRKQEEKGLVLVLCAGTADLPVAEEAALTADLLGAKVQRVYDVGVAGIHRLLERYPLLRQANVLIVVAGMEGALASVVGGLVEKPVIAVPTSVGYGASFDGLAALLAMLNSCSAGITVVNIDNGFGAGFAAANINRFMKEDESC